VSTSLDAVERVLASGDEADEILRRVVAILYVRLGRFVRVSFVEEDGLLPGPSAGEETETTAFPISFQGRRVADLEVARPVSPEEQAFLERVATLLAPHALAGRDTGGEA
jgi:hypothetical protein